VFPLSDSLTDPLPDNVDNAWTWQCVLLNFQP
jgi:hypothetical protein